MIEFLLKYVAAIDSIARIAFLLGAVLLVLKDRRISSATMFLGFLIYGIGSSVMWTTGSILNENKQAGGHFADPALIDQYQIAVIVSVCGFFVAGLSFFIRNFRDRSKTNAESGTHHD